VAYIGLAKSLPNWESNAFEACMQGKCLDCRYAVKTKNDTELVTFLPMENVSETGELDCSIKRKPISDVRTGFSSFAKGDVVVAKITPCFENGKGACLDDLDTEIGFGTTEFINLTSFGESTIKVSVYDNNDTDHLESLVKRVMTGSAGQKRVSVGYIKNFTFGIPSSG
jgi:type I restriction enzyme S subunit